MKRAVVKPRVVPRSSPQTKHARSLGSTNANRITLQEKKSTPVLTGSRAKALLNDPVRNKGAAFPRDERKRFGLEALLPYAANPLEIQLKRAYAQFKEQPSNLAKYSFMVSLRDQNIILFFALLQKHLKEMIPVVYTPTVGEAIQKFSQIFRRPDGIFLNYPYRESMEADLASYAGPDDVDLVIVTDSQGILGIGDQGVGGILITIGKAAIYTVGAGIDPSKILCVALDCGTDNQELLNSELYLGWKHSRLQGEEYDKFVDRFVRAASKQYPNALIHFEDFGVSNALRTLERHKDTASVFNDDIQGTGAVAMAAAMSAMGVVKSRLADQRIVVYGAGTAGMGITLQLADAMAEMDNISREEARSRFWLVDRHGLLTEDYPNMRPGQETFARPASDVQGWVKTQEDKATFGLYDVVKNMKPTMLIGTSGQGRSFDEPIVREMAKHVERPIIFPLSNPTKLCEADPADVTEWTNGKALLATGSPFPPCEDPQTGKLHKVAESNNALIYPALGLATVLSKATRMTDYMIMSGARALASLSPALEDPDDSLLPDVADMRKTSLHVAKAVMMAAKEEGVARADYTLEDLDQIIENNVWDPVYRPLIPRHQLESS